MIIDSDTATGTTSSAPDRSVCLALLSTVGLICFSFLLWLASVAFIGRRVIQYKDGFSFKKYFISFVGTGTFVNIIFLSL